MNEFVYPEFIIDKPCSASGLMWSWSVFDPPTQGEYYGGKTYSREQAVQDVEWAIKRVLRYENNRQ